MQFLLFDEKKEDLPFFVFVSRSLFIHVVGKLAFVDMKLISA